MSVRTAAMWGLVVSIMFDSSPSDACTIFSVASGGVVWAGNNEDYYLDVTPKIWVTIGSEDEYGRVCFGFDQGKKEPFAQGGINEVGLFFDAAVTPPGPEPKEKKKPKAPSNMGDRLLAECGNVAEALEWLGKYRLHLLKGSHLLLADSTGHGAVVELIDGEMKIIERKNGYVAATNFSFTKPEMGNFPCPRFDRVRDALRENPEVTFESISGLLQSVAVPKTLMENEGKYGGTLYSNIYDLTHRTVVVYRESNFERPLTIDVEQYLAKGDATYDMDDLFNPAR